MAEYNLGTAKARIEIDSSGASRGSKDVQKSLGDIEAKNRDVERSAQNLGLALAGVGLGLLAGAGIAIKASAEFEAELSKMGAAANLTEGELDKVRDKALQIGRDTSFGAGQAAEAMTALSYAGVEVDEILNGAADAAVSLAEAGEIDVQEAAKLAAAALNTFGLEASDLEGVADSMIGTFANSPTSVSALGQALEGVGATAATLNIPIEDVNTSLGLLAGRGIEGGKAGTTLNRMLLNLQPSSEKAASAMEELGLITEDGSNQFFDAEGNMKSMSEVSGLLSDAMKDLTDEQKTAYMETIFGSRAIAAATALADAGSEGFNDLGEAIGQVSAADVASDKLDNLSGAMTILKGTVETTLIGIGSPVQEALKGIVQSVTGLINRFAEMPESFQRAVLFGLLFVGGLLTMVGTLLVVTVKVRQFMRLIRGLGGIMQLFGGGPVLLVIAGIAALAAGLIYAYRNSETFRDIVHAVWEKVKEVAKNFVDWFVDTALPAIRQVWENLQEYAEIFVEWFSTNVAPKIESVFEKVVEVIVWFRDLFTEIFGIGGPVRKALMALVDGWQGFAGEWTSEGDGIMTVIARVGEVIRTVFDGIVTVIQWAWESVIKPAWTGISWAVSNILIPALILFGQIAKAAWEGISTAIQWAWENIIKPALSGIGSFITGFLIPTFIVMWNVAKNVFEGVSAAVKFAWDKIIKPTWNAIQWAIEKILVPVFRVIQAVAEDVWGLISTAIKFAWDRVIKPLWAAIKLYIDRILVPVFRVIQAVAEDVWGLVSTAIKYAWDRVIKPIWAAIKIYVDRILLPVLRAIWSVAKEVWDNVKEAIKQAWDNVIKPIWNAIKDFIDDNLIPVFNKFKDIGSSAWESVREAIEKAWDIIKPIVETIWNFVKDKLTPVWDSFKESASKAWGALKGIINSALRAIGGPVSSFLSVVSRVADAIGMSNLAGVLRSGADSAAGWGKFHKGGIAGEAGGLRHSGKLRGNEIPAVLLKGEEILTEDDPRHRRNIGDLGLGARSGEVGGLFGRVKELASSAIDSVRKLISDTVRPALDRVVSNLASSASGRGMIGSMIPNAMKKVVTGLADWIGGVDDEAKKQEVTAAPPGSGNLGGTGSITNRLVQAFRNSGIPGRFTSGYRPGDPGWHGKARAADFAGPTPSARPTGAMNRIFDFFAGFGGLRELIYNGRNWNIIRGTRVATSSLSAGLRRAHNNHVHVAMEAGGIVKRATNALIGESGPEAVIPLDRGLRLPETERLLKSILVTNVQPLPRYLVDKAGAAASEGETNHYSFSGDIVLPNVTDRSSAEDLLDGLRQAVRQGA